MIKFLKPLPHKPLLKKDQIDATYKKLRSKVFLGIFLGYASYYLVRKNFSLIKPDLLEMGWDKSDLGMVGAALSIAYGISKFVGECLLTQAAAKMNVPLVITHQ